LTTVRTPTSVTASSGLPITPAVWLSTRRMT